MMNKKIGKLFANIVFIWSSELTRHDQQKDQQKSVAICLLRDKYNKN